MAQTLAAVVPPAISLVYPPVLPLALPTPTPVCASTPKVIRKVKEAKPSMVLKNVLVKAYVAAGFGNDMSNTEIARINSVSALYNWQVFFSYMYVFIMLW